MNTVTQFKFGQSVVPFRPNNYLLNQLNLSAKKLLLILFTALVSALAVASTRDDEIAECRPGEISTWNDGIDRPATSNVIKLSYNHDGAPYWFSRWDVEFAINRAAREWSKCGISVALSSSSISDSKVAIQWNEKESRGNMALANLTQRTLSLSPAMFTTLRSRNPLHDGAQTLQMTISHEMGHFLGLKAHSRRCVDVLSYYHDNAGSACSTRDGLPMPRGAEYRHTLPTACDIRRCRTVNNIPE